MNVLLHQVLSGLATGGIYASVALALVMIYQATHLVNFAQGELAMFSTYIAWSLIQAGMPYWAAFFITVALAFVIGVLIERVIVQPVENAPILSVVIVFIGLLVIMNSLAGWIFSYTIQPFPSPFPTAPLFGNSYVSSHELGSIGVTLVSITRRAMNTTTTASTDACSTGLMTTRSITTPSANDNRIVRKNAGQYGMPQLIKLQAM